jgi:membrane protease YdiL (CAAX protease family)
MAATDQPLLDPAQQTTVTESGRRWFELALVIVVSCGSIFLNGLYVFLHGPGPISQYPHFRWASGLIHELASLLVLGYVLSRRSLRLRSLGLRWSAKDCLAGLPIAVGAYVSYAIGFLLISAIHRIVFGSPAIGPNARAFFGHPSLAVVPFVLLNPFFEELIVRAYLMTEMLELTGSSLLAVLVSVLLQTSYHLYYGWTGALSVGFMFLTFSIFYLKTRRATPIICAHGLIDIFGMLSLR